jgi:hypothetical protein
MGRYAIERKLPSVEFSTLGMKMKLKRLLGTMLTLGLMLSGCQKKQTHSQPAATAMASAYESGAKTYSHNAHGLENQFELVLNAPPLVDRDTAGREFTIFVLPDSSAWFAEHFPKERVQQLGWDYEAELSLYEKSMMNMMKSYPTDASFKAHCQSPESTLAVGFGPRVDAMIPLVQVPVEQFEIEFTSDRGQRESILANFVYVEGAYRYLGKGAYPFWSMPDASSPGKP